MSTIASRLNWSVQIDPGSPVEYAGTCLGADVDLGVEQANAAATLRFTQLPSDADYNVPLYIYAQLGSGTPPILFNGLISGIRRALTGDGWVIRCTDYLARLSAAWSREDRTYTSQDASAVKQNLVEASAIDVSLTDIQAPAGWTLGVGEPVVLKNGDTPRELIRAIDAALPLWATWTAPNGAVTSRPIQLDAPVAAFGQGRPTLDLDWEEDLEDLYNACLVEGAVYNNVPVSELYQEDSIYVIDPPKYRTFPLQSYLIEDPTRAQAVAQAVVTAKNRVGGRGTVTALLSPGVAPADTVTISSSRMGLSATDVYAATVKHTIGPRRAITTIGVKRV